MALYDDNKPKYEKSKEHKDAWQNWELCQRILSKIIWLPDREHCPLFYEVHEVDKEWAYNESADNQKDRYIETKKMKEPLNIVFFFPLKGEKFSMNISFHCPSRTEGKEVGFKEQLCACLNRLGSLGYLEHRDKNNDGSYRASSSSRPADSAWKALFGK